MKFHPHVTSWKTTVMGVGALFTALGDVLYQVSNHDYDFNRLGADAAGIFTGLGLIFAKDADVHTVVPVSPVTGAVVGTPLAVEPPLSPKV